MAKSSVFSEDLAKLTKLARFEGGKFIKNKYTFVHYMQKCSVVFGRGKNADIDVSSQGGGTKVSRMHAKIFYDFDENLFKVEVMSAKGCYIEGFLYRHVGDHVVLKSGYLVKIGKLEFRFVLPENGISEMLKEWEKARVEASDNERILEETAAVEAEAKARAEATGGADRDQFMADLVARAKARAKAMGIQPMEMRGSGEAAPARRAPGGTRR